MAEHYNRYMAQIYGECPYCGMKGVVRSEMESIFMARRECENCKREFLIVDNQIMKPEDYKLPA